MALELPWPAVWVTWLIAAIPGTWCGPIPRDASTRPPVRRMHQARGERRRLRRLLCRGAGGVLNHHPPSQPDDLFYVNLSQWVAFTGAFPVRGTLFSDLVYPMANWPPVASYDAITVRSRT